MLHVYPCSYCFLLIMIIWDACIQYWNYRIFLRSFLKFNFKNGLFFLTEHFECVLQVLYNVVYIKAIAATSCTFTSEEREAWRKKGRHVCTDTLSTCKSHLVMMLIDGTQYELVLEHLNIYRNSPFFLIFHQQWILLKVLVNMSADSETY